MQSALNYSSTAAPSQEAQMQASQVRYSSEFAEPKTQNVLHYLSVASPSQLVQQEAQTQALPS